MILLILYCMPFNLLIIWLNRRFNYCIGAEELMVKFIKSGYEKIIEQIKISSDKNWKKYADYNSDSIKKLKPAVFRKLGSEIYDLMLSYYLKDFHLSDAELNNLGDVQKYFHLTDKEILPIKKKYSRSAVDAFAARKLMDRVFTDGERGEVMNLARHLSLSDEIVHDIVRNNALKIYNESLRKASADRRLTPEEEDELSDIKNNLGLNDDDIASSINASQKLAYMRLLSEVENGRLPEVIPAVPLEKNEISHYETSAERLESKITADNRSDHNSGFSVKISGGIGQNRNIFSRRPAMKKSSDAHPGKLIITSRRIIFVSKKSGFTLPLMSLTHITPYQDGMGFYTGDDFYFLRFENCELIGMLITGAIKKLGIV
jgi:hypothetical protein